MSAATGAMGEDMACDYLSRHGYRVIARNYRTRRGEIDVIAAQKEWLVFVEVKTRRSVRCGFGAEAVTWRKQRHLLAAALAYLAAHPCEKCRFDVIEITLLPGAEPRLRHIEGAFGRN